MNKGNPLPVQAPTYLQAHIATIYELRDIDGRQRHFNRSDTDYLTFTQKEKKSNSGPAGEGGPLHERSGLAHNLRHSGHTPTHTHGGTNFINVVKSHQTPPHTMSDTFGNQNGA